MNKERIDDLVDIIGEEYAKIENTFLIRNSQQLIKYLENPKQWLKMQMESRKALKKDIIAIAKENLAVLNDKTEKVFLLSYREVAKDTIEISETEIVAKDIPEDVKKKIKEMKEFNAKKVSELASLSLKTYTKQVKIVHSLSSGDDLYEVVKRQIPKGIENGVKVVYKDGKEFSWKAYMEMNIRTTIHQEMTQKQMEIGAKTNQVFYIVDSFADCAPDHADYQGKIYYNEECELTEEEQRYIDTHKIQSMQEVTNGEPYLTSRPNCRHNFHAIASSDVISTPTDKLLEEKGYKFGDYKGSNYEALQKQRYNERQIRKWKLKEEDARRIQKETGIKNTGAIGKAHSKVRSWQKVQRELISDNKDVLKRQYDRENARYIVNHLGVRYDYKVVDGELIKK